MGTARGRDAPFCKIPSVPQTLTGNIGAFAFAASSNAPLLGSVIRPSGVRVPCKKTPTAQPLSRYSRAERMALRSAFPRLTG